MLGTESLAAKLNRVLAEETDLSLPDFTDDQIREVARLLPRRQGGNHDKRPDAPGAGIEAARPVIPPGRP